MASSRLPTTPCAANCGSYVYADTSAERPYGKYLCSARCADAYYLAALGRRELFARWIPWETYNPDAHLPGLIFFDPPPFTERIELPSLLNVFLAVTARQLSVTADRLLRFYETRPPRPPKFL